MDRVKAFKSRALLYAERMVSAGSASPASLYHRAYARGLTGLHAPALEDLDASDRKGKPEAAPKWAALLRAYCRYDTAALSNAMLNDRGQAPLAGFLCFLTLEHCGSQSAVMGFGKLALETNPNCLRVVDAMCEASGVIAGHTLTRAGPERLAADLAERLPAVPGLPQSVRDVMPRDAGGWADPDATAAVARALVAAAADDSVEPSWAALGRIVQESQFVHAYRRAYFLRKRLSTDPGDYVASVRSALADHPYREFIEHFAGTGDLTRVVILDPERKEIPLIREVQATRRNDPGMGRLIQSTDDVAFELLPVNLPHAAGDRIHVQISEVEKAEAVSPRMPEALAGRIEADWASVAPRAAQVEAEFGGNPAVGVALARQFEKRGRTDDLLRVLRRYVTVAPDYWAYERIANVLQSRGDEAGWLATLRESLGHEDYALNHARIRVMIAEHYVGWNDRSGVDLFLRAASRL